MPQDRTPASPSRQDLTGRRFGRLTVIGKSNRTDNGRTFPFWYCRCDCGTEKDVARSALIGKLTKTCGCGRAANFRKDGLATRYRREYAIWQAAIQRCHNPKSQGYHRYGARGITVCDRWRSSFAAFIQDMGPRPDGDLSLDRIGNDRGYEPDNCRWATRIQQGRNMRKNRLLTFRGETRSTVEWSEITGIRADTIFSRLKRGWPIDDVLTVADGVARRARDDKGRFL